MHFNVPSIEMHFKCGRDQRRYNQPHHDEVAVVFVGDDGAPPLDRDIIVYPRNKPLQHISHMSANCDPMTYPILFPRGIWVGIVIYNMYLSTPR